MCPRGSGGRGKSVSGQAYFFALARLASACVRSQRDPDFRGEIIYVPVYVPVNHNVYLEER